jgi:hypothetical protein
LNWNRHRLDLRPKSVLRIKPDMITYNSRIRLTGCGELCRRPCAVCFFAATSCKF